LDTNGGNSIAKSDYTSGDNNAAIVKFDITFINPLSSDSSIASNETDTILCLVGGLLPANADSLSTEKGQRCGHSFSS